MGVLVGTSLIVIIPEGVETLYSPNSVEPGHTRRALSSRNLDIRWALPDPSINAYRDFSGIDPFLVPGPVIPDRAGMPPATPTTPGVVGALGSELKVAGQDLEGKPRTQPEEHHRDKSPHAWIGLALISGFILMYMIDKLPQYTSSSNPNPRPHHISLTDLGRRFSRVATAESEAENFLEGANGKKPQSRSLATTTGLVIHAVADGIALGASSSTSNSGLSLIIFFAIMVHKAPAAFGLTSVLLKQGLSKRSARAHLLLFSLAAPLGAILTWLFASSVGAGKVRNPESTKWWTGMLLLFSGGTFLYVAMHSMQEDAAPHEHLVNGHANGFVDGREAPKQEQAPSIRDLSAAIIGMILPLFLQIGHAH